MNLQDPVSRRQALKSIGVGITFLPINCNITTDPFGSSSETPIDTSSSFVERSGSEFVLNEDRFYAIGSNSFWLSYLYWDDDVIQEVLNRVAGFGHNTFRTWAFGNGEYLFQPSPGEFNEEAFERLDKVIAAARDRGIRLVLALGTHWPDFGGIDSYIEWADTAEERDDFYTNSECREMYQDYVEYLLNRENTVTGTRYKDDPTIMMWELMNELRHPSSPDNDGTVLRDWVDTMGAFVKSIDTNHLVTTGSEGFVLGEGPKYDDVGYWMNTQGYDFVDIHDSQHIDVSSIHLYPDHWNISGTSAVEFIRDRATEAREQLNKPIYIGEYGKMVHPESKFKDKIIRNGTYLRWYSEMRSQDIDGAMVWQIVPAQYLSDADAFSISTERNTTHNVMSIKDQIIRGKLWH